MRFPLTVFQFLFILSLSSSNSASAQCLDNQKSSLLTLFGSAPTPSWTPRTDCCSWKGVTCDGSGHVTGLDLTNSSIKASINSTSLTTLSSLRNLNLSLNFFDSSIPVSLSRLSKLTHLNLSNSGFKGHVPVKISLIKSMESLDLSSSILNSYSSLRFSSPALEYVVGNLSLLRELYLDNVDISSPFPPMKLPLALFHFLSIFSLLCSNSASAQCLDNQKSSLLSLFGSAPTPFWTPSTDCCLWKGITSDRSGHVTGLDLTSHSISAPINSTSLTFLSSPRIFNLSHNAVRGNIPSSLFRLPTLQYLNLSNNLFDAPLDELNLPSLSLKSLDLSNNRLRGPIPTSLFQLKGLRTLSLSSNKLKGTKSSLLTLFGSAQIPSWTANTNCCLWKGVVTCESSTGHVTGLDLANHSISAPINSTSLISLSGLVPIELSLIKSLESLGLSCVFNFFEPLRFLGPDFGYVVGNLSGLKELYLDGVNISSPMPESLGMLANLTSLHLTGEIPMKIFQLQDLETLDLQSNPLLPGTCKDWSSLAATSREGFHRR
ncbi:hypothetical protein MRB53_000618 [Persea americana]|uniref:Uncharacterized protein n=1 Tax=Persea americana TaxID=3435 RepID=A0ACC2MPM1_PERAE|nr:hypothetical protein MRB53_000618 [Persea americana]